MGSPCELVCETPRRSVAVELTHLAADEAWRIEDKFSRYIAGTIIERINTAQGRAVEVDDETAQLINFATTLYELSEHLFDISSGVLRKAWRFDGGDRVPDRGAVEDVLAQVGWQRVSWQPPILQMPAGMEIDMGGIGKEYAVDRCAAIVREQGGPPCLVNFGGDLAASDKPRQRRAWQVAIEGDTPDAADRVLHLREGAIATSGDARRFLQKDGIRYSHILDPTTGWPIVDAPASITVAAETCTQAGMISTLTMLKGCGAEAFLEAAGVRHWVRR
ncbi:MAG: FAD:protein FMN transferase [Gammaproteobacteria bacterium]|nr:FAD:protein FMN transferase [Gammaproteobacteria bacterium]